VTGSSHLDSLFDPHQIARERSATRR